MSITQAAYPGLADAQRLYGPWLYTLFTHPDAAVSETGVVSRSTGYTSQTPQNALHDTHLLPSRYRMRHVSGGPDAHRAAQ
ncbi:hypothetical protein PPMP20_34290 [Paraburkholderia phymatum]|nr:hypothetical protein [Paraburkholderia phymatum]